MNIAKRIDRMAESEIHTHTLANIHSDTYIYTWREGGEQGEREKKRE